MRTARWNRSAGANTHSREARGKHTSSSRYKSGDNWVECQRCGHDIYGSDAMEDGYTQGLIVCPKCYDAPHPQDYVRAYEDRISPGSGMVTGETGVNLANGLAGSTSNPAQTSFTGDDFTGSLSAISDQTDGELETISTLTVTTNFPTSIYDTLLGAEQTVASWSALGLPAGLSINSSGQITGTVGATAFDDTPYSVVVTATFTNGYQIANAAFTWNITELSDPSSISDLHLWWDTSERDGNFVFSDLARTVAITNGGTVRGVIDRSGNGKHASIEAEGNAGTWAAAGQNSIGTLDCQAGVGGATPKSIETDATGGLTQIYTVVAVGKVPTPHASERRALISMTASTGTEMRINLSGAGGNNELTTIGVGSSDDGRAWGGETGEWWGFLMEINGSSSGVQYFSRGSATIQDAAPAFNSHNASTVVPATLRFGAGVDGIPNIRSGWDEEVGELLLYNKQLSTAEKNTLVTYLNNKWALSTNTVP